MIAWGASDIVRKWPRLAVPVGAVALLSCLVCLVTTSAQVDYWKNSETLYRRAISVTSNNYVAEYNLGDYLMDIPGRNAEAVSHFENALRIQPDSADARNAIGGYLLQNGRDVEATAQFVQALRSKPDNAEAHFNLGLIYEKDPSRSVNAVSEFEAAAHSKPNWARAQKSLGLLLIKLGRRPEGVAHLRLAQQIQLDPEIARILVTF